MPEGFKAGSAWMDVKPNIDEAAWREKIAAAVEGAGVGAGAPLGSGLSKGLRDAEAPIMDEAERIGKSLGDRLGQDLSTSIKNTMPPLSGLIPPAPADDPVPKREGKKTGDAFIAGMTAAMRDSATPSTLFDDTLLRGLGDKGKAGAGAFTFEFGKSVKAGLTESSVSSMLKGVAPVGRDVGDEIGKGIGEGISRGVDPGLTQTSQKIKDSAKKAGQDAGQQGGLLLGTALIAGAAFAPGLIVAGLSGAVAGIGALVASSNADVRAEFKTTAYDISHEMTDAVSPFVPAVQAALVNVDKAITQEKPQIKALFADAEPDLLSFTTGVTGLATHAIPGLTTAVDRSRGIVSGFTGELPVLGDGIGRMFTGLTTNAHSTEVGITDFVDVTSNLLGTLGHVAGSASAALSEDFNAIEPALNGALNVIDKIANPATVGGLVGAFGAMKFDPVVSKGLQSVSDGLTSVAAKADGARGLLGLSGGAAEKAAGGFGKMADVMGGPWGIAIGAGIGLAGGLISSLHSMTVSASDFTAAVAQDNGVVGASTTAIIQNQIAKLDLTSVQKDLGVSQATLIEYAAGEKGAQEKVNAAYAAKQAALDKLVPSTERLGRAATSQQVATREESNELGNAKARLDAMTVAVKQAIKDQNDQNQAFLAATKSAGIFAGMVSTATTALQTQAEQNSISIVGALQLGDGQMQLGQHLSNIVYNYQLASDAAQAYGSVMTALHGATSRLDDAQNTLDQDVLNAKTSFAQNKYSMDRSTQAGINNRMALSAASKAIVQMGVDQINAGGNIDQANNTINAQITAFVKSTGATGKAKDKIEDYLNKITQIPPDISTTVHANTTPAAQAVIHLLNDINAASGTVQVYANVHNPSGGKALGANAGGGPVTAGSMSRVGEHGEETVLFGQDGYVLTHGQTVSMQSRPQTAAAPAAPHVEFNYYGPQAPGPEQRAEMMRQLAGALT